MIDLFCPHHVSTADDKRMSEIEQAFEVVRGVCLQRGISAKWGINRPKTPQNHSRQHRKTKLSELYLSDCH